VFLIGEHLALEKEILIHKSHEFRARCQYAPQDRRNDSEEVQYQKPYRSLFSRSILLDMREASKAPQAFWAPACFLRHQKATSRKKACRRPKSLRSFLLFAHIK